MRVRGRIEEIERRAYSRAARSKKSHAHASAYRLAAPPLAIGSADVRVVVKHLCKLRIPERIIHNSMGLGVEARGDRVMVGKGFRRELAQHVVGTDALLCHPVKGGRELTREVLWARAVHRDEDDRGALELELVVGVAVAAALVIGIGSAQAECIVDGECETEKCESEDGGDGLPRDSRTLQWRILAAVCRFLVGSSARQ